jgi:hypothetical protein
MLRDEPALVAAILAVCLAIGGAVWFECAHPCRVQGLPVTTLMPMSCGDGCTMLVPMTVTTCLERD